MPSILIKCRRYCKSSCSHLLRSRVAISETASFHARPLKKVKEGAQFLFHEVSDLQLRSKFHAGAVDKRSKVFSISGLIFEKEPELRLGRKPF